MGQFPSQDCKQRPWELHLVGLPFCKSPGQMTSAPYRSQQQSASIVPVSQIDDFMGADTPLTTPSVVDLIANSIPGIPQITSQQPQFSIRNLAAKTQRVVPSSQPPDSSKQYVGAPATSYPAPASTQPPLPGCQIAARTRAPELEFTVLGARTYFHGELTGELPGNLQNCLSGKCAIPGSKQEDAYHQTAILGERETGAEQHQECSELDWQHRQPGLYERSEWQTSGGARVRDQHRAAKRESAGQLHGHPKPPIRREQ